MWKKLKRFILTRALRYAEKQFDEYDADVQLYGDHREERTAWFNIREALEFLTSNKAEEAY